MRHWLFLICFFVSLSTYCFGELKLSLIIPCYYGHFSHLPSLLDAYTQQSRRPDEVVISLSEAHLVDAGELEQLQSADYPFPLIIIASTKKQYAGENRNIACSFATGDVFVCQDADDWPHPRRLEILESLFQILDADHVMHGYCLEGLHLGNTAALARGVVPVKFHRSWNSLKCSGVRVHHGNIAIKRGVFDQVKWGPSQRGQDLAFNLDCLKLFQKTLVIDLPLVTYRPEYSSCDP